MAGLGRRAGEGGGGPGVQALRARSLAAARFITHLRHLFLRARDGKQSPEIGDAIGEAVRSARPLEYACAERPARRTEELSGREVVREEILFLALHVSRLTAQSDAALPDAALPDAARSGTVLSPMARSDAALPAMAQPLIAFVMWQADELRIAPRRDLFRLFAGLSDLLGDTAAL